MLASGLHFSPTEITMITVCVQSEPVEDSCCSLPDIKASKAIPKSIAIPAIAQGSLILLKAEQTFEILLHEWLMRNTQLLQDEGFEGQELAAAVNGLMQDVLFVGRSLTARLKTLQVPLN
jgi:hypothetical protein